MKNEFIKRLLSSIILIPLLAFFTIKSLNLFIVFLFIVFLISFYEWIKMSKKIHLILIGFIFLFFSFYSAYSIRLENLIYFLFIISICISTDIGGYIFGKLFKGPKLTKISPNKTYSGMLGSFFLAIVTSFFFVSKFDLSYINNHDFNENMFFLLFTLLISLVSQIGDLIISFFKRYSKIKDTGKIFPGHGGILDRIDGMIFVFPFVYFFTNILR
jgi:phosphatidate cytidylyltransferase